MLSVIIGRFQPLHLGHLTLLRQALASSSKTAVVLGSHNSSRNLRNPFTSTERKEMIISCLTPDEKSKIVFLEVRDYFYKAEFWINEVREKVRIAAQGDSEISLYGYQKDFTSEYLNWFQGWKSVVVPKTIEIDATRIRDGYFRDPNSVSASKHLPQEIQEWLQDFSKTDAYENLRHERAVIDEYKKSWAQAPFPPVFVTTDNLITQAGHILLVRRGKAPGKNLLAMPGGFLDPNETLEECALRELEEETHLSVSSEELKKSLVAVKAFDHPLRSSRGRTITHVHHFKLSGERLASYEADDDASETFWMPILDLPKLEDQFFEDHFHMINYFLRSY